MELSTSFTILAFTRKRIEFRFKVLWENPFSEPRVELPVEHFVSSHSLPKDGTPHSKPSSLAFSFHRQGRRRVPLALSSTRRSRTPTLRGYGINPPHP